ALRQQPFGVLPAPVPLLRVPLDEVRNQLVDRLRGAAALLLGRRIAAFLRVADRVARLVTRGGESEHGRVAERPPPEPGPAAVAHGPALRAGRRDAERQTRHDRVDVVRPPSGDRLQSLDRARRQLLPHLTFLSESL